MKIIKWILGTTAIILMGFGSVYTYHDFELGMGTMFGGIFLAALIILIGENKTTKEEKSNNEN